MFSLIKVSGGSMSPTLHEGDIVILIKPRASRAGLIYMVNHSDLGPIIKRAEGIEASGHVRLCGDNPNSTPAAVMGTVEPSRFTGRAIFALGKTGWRKL